jgi:hypothetical protein
MSVTKIEAEKDLVPGILYCLMTTEEDPRTGEWYERDGALVYWTGEGFMDEDGDDRHDHWDYAVPQTTKPNESYIVI